MNINQIVEQDIKEALGMSINELVTTVSTTLETRLNNKPDTSSGYKKAKFLFLKNFLDRLLTESYGNISHAARKVKMDRKLLREVIKKHGLNPQGYKKRFLKPTYAKQLIVEDTIRSAVKPYERVVHQEKIDLLYQRLPHISAHVVEEIPSVTFTWKEAQMHFDGEYIRHALTENKGDVSQTAKKIGVPVRTLYRKIKRQNILPALTHMIETVEKEKATT